MEKNYYLNKNNFLVFIIFITLSIVIFTQAVLIFKEGVPSKNNYRNQVTPAPKVFYPPISDNNRATLSLKIKNQKIVTNKDIKGEINFTSPLEEIAGIDVILKFDPKLIMIKNFQGNQEIFQNIIINNQKQKEGKIKITAYQKKGNTQNKNEELLGYLTFQLLEPQPTSIEIEFNGPGIVTDSNLISEKSKKDLLEKVYSLNVLPEMVY